MQNAVMAAEAQSTVTMTIRNVPVDVRDTLAARAAAAGMSLQEFVLERLAQDARRPSKAEVLAGVRAFKGQHGSALELLTTDELLHAKDEPRR
jgi:hypothetical protein